LPNLGDPNDHAKALEVMQQDRTQREWIFASIGLVINVLHHSGDR